MKRNYAYLLSGLMVLGTLVPTVPSAAQKSSDSRPPLLLRRIVDKKSGKKKVDVKKQYPLLSRIMSKKAARSPFKTALMAAPGRRATLGKAPMKRAEGTGRELWGNVAYQEGWSQDNAPYGLYSFTAQSPLSVNMLFENSSMIANGGAALIDGMYHAVELNTDYASWGMVLLYHTVYDTETGEMVGSMQDISDKLDLAATETAQDASGTVYGEFFTSDLSSTELGVIDYDDMTRTTIGSLSQTYVALGMSKEGVLYGVSSDGNLYSIDKTTAAETKIGPTGLTIANDQGSYYGQSGEIDPATNTFYWAAIDIDGNSALYTVDLATGAASKVADFPASEQIYGVVVPKPAAADAAPAKAENLTASFPDGALSGTLSFDVPAKTYGGQNLTGDVSYTVSVDGEKVKEGAAAAGAKTDCPLDVTEGSHKFVVVLSNAAGDGPKASLNAYVGYDTPKPVADVKFDLDKTTGKATVSWTAPTEGVHSGYMGELKYDVVRYPDKKKVAEGLTATSFEDELPTDEQLTAYSYGVTAVNGEKRSEEVKSGTQAIGLAIVPPYFQGFDDESSFSLFTVLDANSDEKTWSWNSVYSAAEYIYDINNNADDWLMTPTFKLEGGKVYTVTFKTWRRLSSFPEKLEVKYGKGITAADMTETLVEGFEVPVSKTVISKDIVMEEDGEINLGFHAISDANNYALYVDSICVSAGKATTAPGATTDLKVIPDASGALSAKVSFTAPDKNYAGKPGKDLTKVEVLRDGEVVKTFDAPAKGEALSFDDAVEKPGAYSYAVVAYNADGQGATSAAVTVYIGEDTPLPPSGIKAADKQTAVGLSWSPVAGVGANGGIVKPENVKYRVYNLTTNEYGSTVLGDVLGETASTSFDVEVNTTEGEQNLLQYALDAYSSVGESNAKITPAVLSGKAYDLPFVEGFAAAGLSYDMWWTSRKGSTSFNLSKDNDADGDGGSALFSAYEAADSAWLNSGKIALAGAKKASLVFSHKSEPGSAVSLTVQIQKADGTVDDLKTFDYATMTGDGSWTSELLDLSAYASEPYVIVKFLATAGESGVGIPLYIDHVVVSDLNDYDLAASLSLPKNGVTKGSKAKLGVKVENQGSKGAANYTVKLSVDGEVLASQEESGELGSFESKTYEFDYAPTVFAEGDAAKVKAEVVFEADEKTENNVAEADLALAEPNLTKPESVTAQADGSNVEVAWTVPSASEETITDSFEDYDSWATSFGDWTTVDGDGGTCQGLFQSISYPTQGTPFAFTVFDPEDMYAGITEQSPEFAAHTGSKYLAAVYSTEGQNFVNNDDWLISPSLSGKEQTVSFWVSNMNTDDTKYPESFDVLASTTGTDVADFTKIGDSYTVSDGAWTEITVTLPAGTKYFAIHHNTDKDNSFFFMVDDVTFTIGSAAPSSFNVYRDGVKVATAKADDRSFTDSDVPEGRHVYSVTAVYDKGESMPVSAEVDVTTGISKIEADADGLYTVYTLEGKLVGKGLRSLDKLPRGVYVINDKKAVVK